MRRVEEGALHAESRAVFVHFTQKCADLLVVAEFAPLSEEWIRPRPHLVQDLQLAQIVYRLRHMLVPIFELSSFLLDFAGVLQQL